MTIGLLVNILLGLGLAMGVLMLIALVLRIRKGKTSNVFTVQTRPEIQVIDRLLREDDKANEEKEALARLKTIIDKHSKETVV